MKILNNINGSSILIIKLRGNNQLISLQEYEFGTLKPLKSFNFDLQDFKIIDYQTQTLKTFEEIYQYLETKLKDYKLSSDMQNWTIPQGVENPTTLRVYLPSILLNKELDTGSSLDLLIKAMQPLKNFKQVTENGSLQYLSYIEDTAKAILESYADKGVIIEYKN